MMVPRLNTLASLVVSCSNHARVQALFVSRGYCGSTTSLLLSKSQPILEDKVNMTPPESTKTIPAKWLVVGDGDLSYSSTIVQDLADSNIQLIASVLEEQDVHNRVYKRSVENSNVIASHGNHEVKFGIDATKLEHFFPDTSFDCIEFNFPHWRGKTNNRYNRELLDNFLRSAAAVIKPNGEIRVALCDGQGGMPAESLEAWKRSWMAASYANNHGLLLKRLEPYDPDYGLSSHRGVDRPFSLGQMPQKHTFSLPNGTPIDKNFQISCRHELRIILDPNKLEKSPVSSTDIVDGDAVFEFACQFIPDGVKFEVPARDYLTTDRLKGGEIPLAVFLLNYSGESAPLERAAADNIRASIESGIKENWKLDIAKAGRMVSRQYPYELLSKLIKEYE